MARPKSPRWLSHASATTYTGLHPPTPLLPIAKVTCDTSSGQSVSPDNRTVLFYCGIAHPPEPLALGFSPCDDRLKLRFQPLRRRVLHLEGLDTDRLEGQQPAVSADTDAGHAERRERYGSMDPTAEACDRRPNKAQVLVSTAWESPWNIGTQLGSRQKLGAVMAEEKDVVSRAKTPHQSPDSIGPA